MQNKIYLLSASFMVATFSFFSCVSSGEKETGKDEIEKKVENLLGKMTLQEKIGQMNQLSPYGSCLLYTSPSPRDVEESRMPSSA